MKNLIQAAVVTLFAASAAQAQQAVQWRVQDGGNGHWYRLIAASGGLTWLEARSLAISAGGDLATPSSATEDQFVQTIIAGAICGGPSLQAGPYVGGYQDVQAPDYSEPAGGWRWVDDSLFPGGATVDLDNDQGDQRFLQYISVQAGCQGPFRLDDVGLQSQNRSCIIEWSADCNNDGIVDYGQIRNGDLADSNGNNIPDCCEQGSPCVASGTYAFFTRPTDTVRIGSNTSFAGDYTLEWSGFVLDQPVATNPPATWNARIWSEQDSVTEDKTLALNSDRTPVGWVNTTCYQGMSGPSLPVLQRTHVALVRLGSVRKMYVDGVEVATSNEPCDPFNGGGSNMALGAFVYVAQPASNFWRAAPIALDWIRVSNSARYSAGFTPPSEASLGVDAQTQLLMKFEGPNPWRDLANPSAIITPGAGVQGGTSPTISTDCNLNGIPDQVEIASPGADQNGNGLLDVCEVPTCYDADFFRDRFVNGADLGILLIQWGPNGQYTVSDLNHDGIVDANDLGIFLSLWGPCPY